MKSTALVLLLAAAIVGCQIGAGSGPGHAPTRALVAGTKGLYLQASSAKSLSVSRTLGGKSIVSSTTSTLGQITSSGIPETATFTDDTGAQVTVTITQGMQLTSQFVLLSYTYAGGSGTGILDMASGNLANLSQVPDNWPLVFARGSQAWYVSRGSLWRAELASGNVTDLSDGSYTWNGTPSITGQAAWSPNTWVYADALGNVYAMYEANSSSVQGTCIPTSGPSIDFGNNATVASFWNADPTHTTSQGGINTHTAYDPATGNLYFLESHDIWDGNPLNVGGSTITGTCLQAYPVTLTPSGGVISIATYPTAAAVLNAGIFGTTYVGFASALSSALWTNGTDTVTGAVSGSTISLSHYDTSAVPSQGTAGPVTNWQWSGGQVYYGPATAQTIGITKLSGTSGMATQLVNDSSPIVSWSVVGGVLFYTDGMGTYQATVNTGAGTISTPQVYTGGTVQGVTQ